jgi:fatty acid synthase subunit alpha
MLNGCLQVLNTGLVPGNRNADNVDQVMEKFDYIVYPNRTLQTDGIKAFSVTSFGFGQKGAQAIGIHPKYLYAVLDEAEYAAYCDKVDARQKKAYRYFHNGLINNTLFVAKDKSPYSDEQLSKVLLNPDARVSSDAKTADLKYATDFMKASERKISPEKNKSTLEAVTALSRSLESKDTKVGVDVEDIAAINIDNEAFIERNFTPKEIEYCRKAPSPQSSFAGRWSAKEAVFKSLGVASRGAGAPLKSIQILPNEDGTPVVSLHGDAAAAAKEAGVKGISVSISHSDTQAIAVAVASF